LAGRKLEEASGEEKDVASRENMETANEGTQT